MSRIANRIALTDGQRVRFPEEVERYPHFIVPAGTEGIVSYADEDWAVVTVAAHVPGLTEHWDSEFQLCMRDHKEGHGWCDLCGMEMPNRNDVEPA